uniref:DUF7745 domain-containing protein n=1 Tax=Fagus sylvatica TaxID=28930 RepID=A0A2N9EGD8_FAGSY
MTMPTSWESSTSFPLSCGYELTVACLRLLFPSGIRPTVVFPSGRWILFPPWRKSSVKPSLGEVFGFGLRSLASRRSSDQRRLGGKPKFLWNLLTKYFSRSVFPSELAGDFIVGKRGWKKFRINAFKIAFAGIFLFPTSAGRIDLGVIPLVFSEGKSIIPAILCETVRSSSYCRGRGEGVPMFCIQLLQLWFCSHLQHFYRLQIPYHFERYTVRQTVNTTLLFIGNSRDWALYLLDLPLGCGVVQGYYPSLTLRQFGGVQYPPRLGDLSAVTFYYIPGEDMWMLLFRIEDIWGGRLSEMVLIEGGLHGDSSVTPDFVEWKRGVESFFYSQAYRTARHIIFFGVSFSSGFSLYWASEREESTARVESMRSTLHHNSVAVANLRRDLEALVDPSTGRPHDIVALRRALDESEVALTSARTSIGAMRVQISVLQGDNGVLQTEVDLVHDALESNASWLNQEGFPVVTALHQINQVMDSSGC